MKNDKDKNKDEDQGKSLDEILGFSSNKEKQNDGIPPQGGIFGTKPQSQSELIRRMKELGKKIENEEKIIIKVLKQEHPLTGDKVYNIVFSRAFPPISLFESEVKSLIQQLIEELTR